MNLSVRSNWWILYWRFELICLSSLLKQWLCGHVVINIGDFNIGKFSENRQSPILIPCQKIVLYSIYTIINFNLLLHMPTH